MSIFYNGKNIQLAKNLRKSATPQENHLWFDFLSHYPVRFQRQKAIGNYIADFYCHKAKLIIEIDGSGHRSLRGVENDTIRTKDLNDLGLRVVRFSNRQVDQNFREVCAAIDRIVKESIEKSFDPVP